MEGWAPTRQGPRGLQGREKCARGVCWRSPGPGGNSNYGVLEKMFCYLPQMTPPHVREPAAKEKSQIQSFTQPLMWALRRFHGTRQALFWGETCQECWRARCCDWKLRVLEFPHLHGRAASALYPTIETIYLPTSKPALVLGIKLHKYRHDSRDSGHN